MQVKDYLFQVEPHLWVDNIEEITDHSITTSKHIAIDHPVLKAHFPGAPVLPGSMVQEMCTQSAAIYLTEKFVDPSKLNELAVGVLLKVDYAKYKSIVIPPETCMIFAKLISQALDVYKFKAEVFVNEELLARMQFSLGIKALDYLKNKK